VLLSGGIDSSLLVALLPEEIRRETRTFSIGFEGGGYHDERAYARQVAGLMGTRHREFAAPLDVAAELPRLVGFLDEPLADPAALPAHLVARAAAPEVTVLLSGTGGDEVFGGYRRYRMGELLRKVAFIPRRLAGAGAMALADSDQHRRSRAGERMIMVRKLLHARSKDTPIEAYLTALETATPERWAEALAVPAAVAEVGRSLLGELVGEVGRMPRCPEELAFTFDHLYYLPDDLLLKEDRTTMGTSVEGRVPYLDHPLVEFAAAQSLESRLGDPGGKQVLRVLARRHLPPEIAERPKHGFSVPFEEWLRGPLQPLVRETFAGPTSGIFQRPVLERWLDEHVARRDRAWPLWTALCFELWWSRVGSASPAALADAGQPLMVRR
jgi:asparagine synthase (glutamine-hydrolysing)